MSTRSSISSQPLDALVRLFTALNAQGIDYCHWKSNCNLDRSLSGLTDLDMLVNPEHMERFAATLDRHNVKLILSPLESRYPDMQDYLGFDPDTGGLFHLHVHYRLVLGEQFVKNYRLPLEQAFWQSAQLYQGLVKIPCPELELVVLAIRALLKYRDRDVVKDVLSIRSPGLPGHIRREFEYLLERADRARVSDVLERYVEFLSPETILELLDTVANSPRAGRVLYRLRKKLRRELAPYQRHSRWWATRKYLGVLLRRRFSFLFARRSKTPATGGVIVAIVGADGAGKSTVVKALLKWLSWKLTVRRHYMGSQERSFASQLFRLVYLVARKTDRVWSGFVGEKRVLSRITHRWLGLSRHLYYASTAVDRYRRYKAAKRQAAEGMIVICDRYPLAAIHQAMAGQPMDGPRIVTPGGDEPDTITKKLGQWEQNLYQKILPPDHVFALQVSPDVSLRRKPEHDLDVIEMKSQALEQIGDHGLPVTIVDADEPFEQVLLNIKTRLWQLL